MVKFLTIVWIILVASLSGAGQGAPRETWSTPDARVPELLGGMSNDIAKISRSVETLSGNWKAFFDSFSTNQGLRLTERQQRLLLAFEMLNRSEQRLANLQKMRMDSTQKLSTFRLQLARITDDLLPESIDRYVVARGSLNAEQLRDIRRQALQRERSETSTIAGQIQRDLDTTNEEIRATERFVANIRSRLFPEIEKELREL